MPIPDRHKVDIEGFVVAAQKYGAIAVALESAKVPGSLQERRRAAIFIATFLGHRVDSKDLREQPYGYVGQCRCCDQVLRIPREQGTGPAFDGRAAQNECPVRQGGI